MQRGKRQSSINGVGKVDSYMLKNENGPLSYMLKNENGPLSYTICKNKLKMD